MILWTFALLWNSNILSHNKSKLRNYPKPCNHIYRSHYRFPFELSTKTSKNGDDQICTENDEVNIVAEMDMSLFEASMVQLEMSSIRTLLKKAKEFGFQNSMELYHFSRDFSSRPEVLSSLLQSDFGVSPFLAHQMRSALLNMVEQIDISQKRNKSQDSNTVDHDISADASRGDIIKSETKRIFGNAEEHTHSESNDQNEPPTKKKQPLFKSVVVNQKQKIRRGSNTVKSSGPDNKAKDENQYGLPLNCQTLYPKLSKELDDFYFFMTEPTAVSQDPPIRPATANVYLRHARLFLGWYISEEKLRVSNKNGQAIENSSISLLSVIKDKERESASDLFNFVLFLRKERNVSDSYEANMLRGLIKLIKFRFAEDSSADPSYGEKSFHDVPVIRELRRLHRDANQRQKLSPRSSDEGLKWIDWEEYLSVVKSVKNELESRIKTFTEKEANRLIADNDKKGSTKQKAVIKDKKYKFSSTERQIATIYQYYLILAFFSCIPDRQRTFREIDLKRNFLKGADGTWIIKHGPDDYKTGRTYGDRPPLVISPELTPSIDLFIDRWRPCLEPVGGNFFSQPRTGKPFTADSVYSLVARQCYKYTGRKTNPHLLRDMIVTHVRKSDASEKELEALALYMGHSISMQRDSYDRRTLNQKVAPAINLLNTVNNGKATDDG